jgi:cytochrome c551/c552
MKPIVLVAVLLAAAARSEMPDTLVMERGEAAFRKNGCYGCHIIQKFGTPIGPNLTQVGRKYHVGPRDCPPAFRRSGLPEKRCLP